MTNINGVLAELKTNGVAMVPDLLNSAGVKGIRDNLAPFLERGESGRNDFEGLDTQRVYTLVARGKVQQDLVEHPVIIEVLDQLLKPNYLLSANQAINIHPGETAQNFHSDDPFYPLPRPRPPISISVIWAITDFTEENGATDFAKGSHTLGASVPEFAESDITPGVMSAGSCMIYYGTTLHRGGNNKSSAARLGISNQYCEPWARTQENFFLAVPHDRVRTMSEQVQSLLGYSIYPPFMGQLSGSHPRKALEENYVVPVVQQEAS